MMRNTKVPSIEKLHPHRGQVESAAGEFQALVSPGKQETYCLANQLRTSALLFSYGTLQDRAVQLANFGRELSGSSDSLPGYSTSPVAIRDPEVIAASGKTHHRIAERSENPADEVPGVVFQITPDELAAADRYEVSEYTRVQVTLKSGLRAWAYVRYKVVSRAEAR